VEFTKSCPRHSNDNGLVETKNGAIVRKHLGYSHIPQRYASEVNAFCQEFLNPYVNFHRPCFFAESFTDDKGKTRKRYLLKNRMTPYGRLKSLPNAKRFLKPGLTFKQLDQTAKGISDNEAPRRLNEARNKLFLSQPSIQTCSLKFGFCYPRSDSNLNPLGSYSPPLAA
jgi:hypothetical protein